jgi:7-carboxy-7-deazaguanine synthase
MTTTVDTARVIEVFSSVQGEGPYVGVRQIFIRFVGCNIRCIYCDTKDAFINPEHCLVETCPGSREFDKVRNPLSVRDLLSALRGFFLVPHHSISLTGGEPLLHVSFLKLLLPELRQMGMKIYLETNGVLSQQLESVLEWLDIISMDIKLPSTLEHHHDLLDEHEDFLKIAASKEVFVKLVVASHTPENEVVQAVELVHSVDESIPVILQPVTPGGDLTETPSPQHLLALQSAVMRIHEDVRVIPQVHVLMGQL